MTSEHDRHDADTANKPRSLETSLSDSFSIWNIWDVLLSLVVLGVVYTQISGELRLGPAWLLPTLLTGLLVARIVVARTSRHDVSRRIGVTTAVVGTVAIQGSVFLLVRRLLQGDVSAPYLLRDAALLWVANVIVFGIWYWELDGGGPHHRRREGYQPTDLAFPQIQLGQRFSDGWTPEFVDYLFVAFNASAAFSPTDTSFLSRRAKLLMMAQAIDSVVLLAVVAARAINTLH